MSSVLQLALSLTLTSGTNVALHLVKLGTGIVELLVAGRVSPLRHVHSEAPRQPLLLSLGRGGDGAELLVHGIAAVGSLDGDRCPTRHHTAIPVGWRSVTTPSVLLHTRINLALGYVWV